MTMQRGKKHQINYDGQTVWLDSLNEEIALKQFVEKYGFSEKWTRPSMGIKHAGKYYSPDFELAIDDYGNTSRALVEVKEYRKDFIKDIAARMCTIAHHYHTNSLYLYAVKTDKWYSIVPKSGMVRETTAPQPGELSLSELFQPKRFATKNYYGRIYSQSWIDSMLSLFRSSSTSNRRKRKSSSKHKYF